MVKNKIFLLFTLFLFTLLPSFSVEARKDINLNFLSNNKITKEEKKEKLIKIIEELREEINILIKKREEENENLNNNRRKENNLKLLKSIQNNLNLRAKSYSVHIFNPNDKNYLNNSQKIFYKNENNSYSLASVTKLMTTITAWENFDHNKIVKISQKALNQFGDFGLILNEKFSLYDSMVLMLTHSSNDMAYAISTSGYTGSREKFFILMNQKAKKIGMKNYYFHSESGLDYPEGKSTAKASAEDIIILLKYFLKNYPKLSARTVKNNIVYSNLKKHIAYNTNKLLSEYYNFKLSKTGLETSAGGNLTTIYKLDKENYIAVVILGSTEEGRFLDTEKVIRATRKYLALKK